MINVTSDTAGHTNEYIFKTKPREGLATTGSFPDIELQNVSVSYADPKRKKDYAAIIHSLKGAAKDVNGILHIKVNVRMLARNISFNTIRGAYMKEKMFEGKIFFGVTKTPILKIAFANNKFAEAEPVPLTFAKRTTKSFILLRSDIDSLLL